MYMEMKEAYNDNKMSDTLRKEFEELKKWLELSKESTDMAIGNQEVQDQKQFSTDLIRHVYKAFRVLKKNTARFQKLEYKPDARNTPIPKTPEMYRNKLTNQKQHKTQNKIVETNTEHNIW